MKTIKNFINESKQPKYVIKFYVKGVGNDMRYSNNWTKDISETPISNAEYWEVLDFSKWNFSDYEALIAWHGEKSYWGTLVKYAEHPEDAPKWWNNHIKGRELEVIKNREK